MRRFVSSAWFPFLTALLLAGGAVLGYVIAAPNTEFVAHPEISKWMNVAGWATGPVMFLLSWILMALLNGLRRLCRIRQVGIFHVIVALCGTLPWFIFAWILSEEPPFTPFARGVMEFVARPMLWGSLIAIIFIIVTSLTSLLIPSKKR